MIHEGTHGIQAADLLGRKVRMEGGLGLRLLGGRVNATIERAAQRPELAGYADQLSQALEQLNAATQAAWASGDPAEALANAVPYMQAFGHLVLAWTWLDVVQAIPADAASQTAFHVGKRRAMSYFYHYELPKIGAWLQVVAGRDRTCADTPEEAF
jgi:hypothetical protein